MNFIPFGEIDVAEYVRQEEVQEYLLTKQERLKPGLRLQSVVSKLLKEKETSLEELGLSYDEFLGIALAYSDVQNLIVNKIKIIKLIEDGNLRKKFGMKGREVAEEKFSWKNVAEDILAEVND